MRILNFRNCSLQMQISTLFNRTHKTLALAPSSVDSFATFLRHLQFAGDLNQFDALGSVVAAAAHRHDCGTMFEKTVDAVGGGGDVKAVTVVKVLHRAARCRLAVALFHSNKMSCSAFS